MDKDLFVYGDDVTQVEKNRKTMNSIYSATFCSFNRMKPHLIAHLGMGNVEITKIIPSVNGLLIHYYDAHTDYTGTRTPTWPRLKTTMEDVCVLENGAKVIGVKLANQGDGVAVIIDP